MSDPDHAHEARPTGAAGRRAHDGGDARTDLGACGRPCLPARGAGRPRRRVGCAHDGKAPRGACVSGKKPGWVRRLVGYLKPHKKNAYVAFGVAIGGQLIQSLLPVVQKVVVDDVITTHRRPLAPWLTLMIVMGVATFVCAYFRRFRGGRIALGVPHHLRTSMFRQLRPPCTASSHRVASRRTLGPSS